VAVSPQLPAISLEMRAQMKLAFDLLFDAGNKVAAYGIAMRLPDDLIKVYASRGIDLRTFDGDSSWRLPVPARIVLATGGTVFAIEADPDYTRRPEPEDTLAALRGIQRGATDTV
jgi:peroxiredoxin